jgi:sec-independent protein translocase protein TatB
MCGISGFEFTVIMIAAIIVLGPEKLPELLRMFGKLTKQIRRWKGDLGDIAKDVQSSLPVDQIRKEMSEGLDLERARTHLKETESEIDALRSRLKAKVAEEEADIERVMSGDAKASAAANSASTPDPTLDAPAEPALDAPSSEGSAAAGPTSRPLRQAGVGVSLVGAGVDDDYGTAPSAPLPSIKQAAHSQARASASVVTPVAPVAESTATPDALPTSLETQDTAPADSPGLAQLSAKTGTSEPSA